MNGSGNNTRSTKDGPFCWQSKLARREIRQAFDHSHNTATALSVYDGLTEIASDHACETFQTTHAHIAGKSGVSPRTVQAHLKVFAALGLIAISTPKLRAPSTFTLLSLCNDCGTPGNDFVAFSNGPIIRPLPSLEESKEKREKKAALRRPRTAWSRSGKRTVKFMHSNEPKDFRIILAALPNSSLSEFASTPSWSKIPGYLRVNIWEACERQIEANGSVTRRTQP